MDLNRRFGGIARLYGPTGLARLQAAHVAVVGVGGVGSWVVEALARSGVGALQLVDLDHVAESNMNRQLPATDSQLGRAKVSVLAERVRDINPDCAVRVVEEFLTADNLDLLPAAPAYVVDCIDSYRVKAALVAHCRRVRQPVLTVGAAGGQIDPTRVRVSDLRLTRQDPLLAKTRRLLRTGYGFPRNTGRRFAVPAVWSDEPVRAPAPGADCALQPEGSLNCAGFGSCMPVTAAFAMAAAGYVVADLAGVRVVRAGGGGG